jgi:hypothetical protein
MANKKLRQITYSLGVLALLFSLVLVRPANAILTLQVTDGGPNNVIVTDGGAGDGAAQTGAITYTNTFGSLIFNVESGLSKPLIGSVLAPEIHLDTIFANGAPINLTIRLSDTDFSGPGILPFIGSIGGITSTPSGTIVTLSVYRDLANALFGTGIGNLICTTGPLTGSFSFGSTCGSNVSVDDAYSVTIEATIQQLSAGNMSFNAIVKDVPEASAMFLLGIGLIGFAGWARMKSNEEN